MEQKLWKHKPSHLSTQLFWILLKQTCRSHENETDRETIYLLDWIHLQISLHISRHFENMHSSDDQNRGSKVPSVRAHTKFSCFVPWNVNRINYLQTTLTEWIVVTLFDSLSGLETSLHSLFSRILSALTDLSGTLIKDRS